MMESGGKSGKDPRRAQSDAEESPQRTQRDTEGSPQKTDTDMRHDDDLTQLPTRHDDDTTPNAALHDGNTTQFQMPAALYRCGTETKTYNRFEALQENEADADDEQTADDNDKLTVMQTIDTARKPNPNRRQRMKRRAAVTV